jgi:hypothetical protein
MKSLAMHRAFAALATITLLAAGTAQGAFRAYLASNGSDLDPCSLQQPCRLLPAALTAVDPGGEVWMLDSANYNTGNVSVTKSVTILAIPGAVGSIVGNSADGLSIATAGVKVVLRNLVFVNLAGASNNGITMTNGTSLTVLDSIFYNMPNAAIYINNNGIKAQIIGSKFVNNAVAVRVFGGVVAMVNNELLNSAIAIEAAGPGHTGASGNATYPPNGTTRVYVTGGNILNSGTVFHMDSAGPRQSGQCNGSNIFFNNPIQILGFTTQVNVTTPGSSDLNSGCSPGQFTIDGYSTPAN